MRFQADRRLIFVLAGLVWLEVACLPYLSIRLIRPDLFFIFLVFYAFRVNWKNVIALAFLLGLARDLVSSAFFGLETAAYTVGAMGLRFLAIRFDREKRWIQLASLFSFSCVTLLVFSCFVFVIYAPGQWGSWWISKLWLVAMYTTVVGWLLFPFLERWLRPALRGGRQYELF